MAEAIAHDVAAAVPGEGVIEVVPKKSKKKLIIMIAAPLLLLILVGAGLFFSGILGGKKEDKPVAEAAPVFYNVPDQMVNLSTDKGKPVFLRISMSLELTHAEDLPAVEKELPRIIDNFQVYLRELHVDELKGSAGMYRLREELLMRVNNAVQPIQIKDVLFREMLVQ